MKKIICVLALLLIPSFVAAYQGNRPGLEVGVLAPDFEAKNHKGRKVELSKFYKDGPVILLFYRGGWCPYCNLQLQDYQKHMSRFEELDVSVIAVSVDKQEKAKETVKEEDLDIEVVSDPDAALLEKYNLIYQVPAKLAKTYKEEYNIDLEAHSGRNDHVIAVPATYVIDQNGQIVFADANEDYKVRVAAAEILKIVSELTSEE